MNSRINQVNTVVNTNLIGLILVVILLVGLAWF